MEVWCISLNDKKTIFLVPVALIPTCKKDYQIEQSTTTITTIGKIIIDKYYKTKLCEKIGLLSSCISDGASHFRKGMGKALSEDLTSQIRDVYKDCKLFNKVGGQDGTTNQCDPNHLGKRSRAKINSQGWIKVANITFTKTNFVQYLALVDILSDAGDASRLFDNEDNMDVAEIVKCLDAIGQLTELDILQFPASWYHDDI